MSYSRPTITPLGSVRDLTQKKNKIGGTPDALSAIDSDVVGSYVEYNP